VSAGPVVVIGSMGSGKTSVARRLAERLGRPFLDNDATLQAHTGCTAAEIFARDGADALHRMEAAALFAAVAAPEPAVIAAAASVGDLDGLRERLGPGTGVVWLRARPATLKRRALAGSHRPFVHGDPDAVARLDAARRGAYEAAADVVLDAENRTVDELAADAERALENPSASS